MSPQGSVTSGSAGVFGNQVNFYLKTALRKTFFLVETALLKSAVKIFWNKCDMSGFFMRCASSLNHPYFFSKLRYFAVRYCFHTFPRCGFISQMQVMHKKFPSSPATFGGQQGTNLGDGGLMDLQSYQMGPEKTATPLSGGLGIQERPQSHGNIPGEL